MHLVRCVAMVLGPEGSWESAGTQVLGAEVGMTKSNIITTQSQSHEGLQNMIYYPNTPAC